MEQIIQLLMEYLRDHAGMGALCAFLIAFAESLPFIGTLIPAQLL